MKAAFASERGTGLANEDYAVCGPDWAAVFDGATAPAGADSGCAHSVAWLAAQLASAVAARMPGSSLPLDELLADAIADVRGRHSGCDLDNPDSPSSTAALCRIAPGRRRMDYLVLADSPVLLRHPGGRVTAFDDDRTARLPGGRPYSPGLVRKWRNRPGGFWVAGAKPEAAYQALRGSAELEPGSEVALLTDGAARLAEHYGHSWDSVFGTLREHGPDGLIRAVRAAENRQPPPHGKPHDDATAVLLTAIDAP
jgi:hypothetical protein